MKKILLLEELTLIIYGFNGLNGVSKRNRRENLLLQMIDELLVIDEKQEEKSSFLKVKKVLG